MDDLMDEILKLEDGFFILVTIYSRIPMDEILKLEDARDFLYLLQPIHEWTKY